MSMCRVFSCVVGRGCLLWPVRSLGRTLLSFALLHSVPQGQICLLLQVFLDFLLLHSSPLQWKGHLFRVLDLKGLVGLHRTVQLQLLQHNWLGHRLGLPWYWMVCLGKEQRSFCRFWGCIHSALMGRTHSDLETASGLPPPDSSLSLRQGLVTYLLFWFCHHRNHIGEKATFLKLERETHGGGWEGLCCPLSVGFC